VEEKTRDFWIWDVGKFIRVKNITKVESFNKEDYNVLDNKKDLLIKPEESDEVFKGKLISKCTGKREGIKQPEVVGEWENISPLEVIVCISRRDDHEFISVYPIPKDIKFDF
jgi:hypothetical protein